MSLASLKLSMLNLELTREAIKTLFIAEENYKKRISADDWRQISNGLWGVIRACAKFEWGEDAVVLRRGDVFVVEHFDGRVLEIKKGEFIYD